MKISIILSILVISSSELFCSGRLTKFSSDPDRLTRAVQGETQEDNLDDFTLSRSFLQTRRCASTSGQTIVRNSSPKALLGGNQR